MIKEKNFYNQFKYWLMHACLNYFSFTLSSIILSYGKSLHFEVLCSLNSLCIALTMHFLLDDNLKARNIKIAHFLFIKQLPSHINVIWPSKKSHLIMRAFSRLRNRSHLFIPASPLQPHDIFLYIWLLSGKFVCVSCKYKGGKKLSERENETFSLSSWA